jgi:hypothetical protein
VTAALTLSWQQSDGYLNESAYSVITAGGPNLPERYVFRGGSYRFALFIKRLDPDLRWRLELVEDPLTIGHIVDYYSRSASLDCMCMQQNELGRFRQ